MDARSTGRVPGAGGCAASGGSPNSATATKSSARMAPWYSRQLTFVPAFVPRFVPRGANFLASESVYPTCERRRPTYELGGPEGPHYPPLGYRCSCGSGSAQPLPPRDCGRRSCGRRADAGDTSGQGASGRRHPRRRGVDGRAAAGGHVAVLQPAARRPDRATDHRLGRLRRRCAVLCLPLRRPRSCRHQDVDHAPRQHLGRRLGRLEPRRPWHRTGVVSPDGESQRHSARHDQHHRRQRRHVAGLDLGERGARQRSRVRRGDPAAPADHPLQGRRGRQHGHPVLAPREPHGRVGGLAGARAGQVGVREAREACVFGFAGAADARVHPLGHLLLRAGPRDAVGLGDRQHWRSRTERQMGSHLDDHAGRDGESGFQPGRKRRLPGGGQPALPRVLLGEAPVLHGRRRHVQSRRQRPGRCLDALRRQHPQHRRSDIWREAHRVGRTCDVWQPDGHRPGARAHRRPRRSAVGKGEGLPESRARR